MDRNSSAPRSNRSDESGPANSTRISGRSQSRSSAITGSTVMRYFSLSPACLTMPFRNPLSWFADSILFIKEHRAFSYELHSLHAMSLLAARGSQLFVFLSRPLGGNFAHFFP